MPERRNKKGTYCLGSMHEALYIIKSVGAILVVPMNVCRVQFTPYHTEEGKQMRQTLKTGAKTTSTNNGKKSRESE